MSIKVPSLILLLVGIALSSARANAKLLSAQAPAPQVINEVAFRGAKTLNIRTLLRASKLKRGSVVTDDDLNKAAALVSEKYGSKGFGRVRVSTYKRSVTSPSGGKSLKVDIVFDIEEGPQFFVRFLEIVGTRATDDKIVRRSTGIKPWEPYNPRSIDAALKRLNRIQTLDVVNKEDIEIKFDEANHFVDLRFNLKERS